MVTISSPFYYKSLESVRGYWWFWGHWCLITLPVNRLQTTSVCHLWFCLKKSVTSNMPVSHPLNSNYYMPSQSYDKDSLCNHSSHLWMCNLRMYHVTVQNGLWVKHSGGNHESVPFGSHFMERIDDTDCHEWKYWCGLQLITTVWNFTYSKQNKAAEIQLKYNLVHNFIFKIPCHFLLSEIIQYCTEDSQK